MIFPIHVPHGYVRNHPETRERSNASRLVSYCSGTVPAFPSGFLLAKACCFAVIFIDPKFQKIP